MSVEGVELRLLSAHTRQQQQHAAVLVAVSAAGLLLVLVCCNHSSSTSSRTSLHTRCLSAVRACGTELAHSASTLKCCVVIGGSRVCVRQCIAAWLLYSVQCSHNQPVSEYVRRTRIDEWKDGEKRLLQIVMPAPLTRCSLSCTRPPSTALLRPLPSCFVSTVRGAAFSPLLSPAGPARLSAGSPRHTTLLTFSFSQNWPVAVSPSGSVASLTGVAAPSAGVPVARGPAMSVAIQPGLQRSHSTAQHDAQHSRRPQRVSDTEPHCRAAVQR